MIPPPKRLKDQGDEEAPEWVKREVSRYWRQYGRREEDRSTVAQVRAAYDRFHPFIAFAIWLLLALGFGFHTPQQLIEGLRHEQRAGDSVITTRIDRIEARQEASFNDREDLRTLLEAIVRYDCIRGEKEQVQLAGLPCARVLENREDDLVKRGARAPGETPR